MTTTEPDWTDEDRGLLLALLAERAEVCPKCGHPVSVCRDPKTAGSWTVVTETCEASRLVEAVAENAATEGRKQRGVVYLTKRT